MKKNNFLFFLGILLVFTIFLINFSSAELSYCCEKTTTSSNSGGAWCQNAPEVDCNINYKKAPTSCESTSYCKLGTCINVNEGTCSENTPQVVCQNNGGIWDEEPAENLGQCQLGCCAIGDQTAYVTQTRCKRLSSLYGLETNYRTDINSELECIITSQPNAEGACVFSRAYERTCLRTTKKECQEFKSSADKENIEFYENYLCSDTDLGTNCGPSKETTCVEGEDRIYYLDTCGNLANVYDSTKLDNKGNWDSEYWSRISKEENICNLTRNTKKIINNAESCGNCDYYFGSTCQSYDVWKKTQNLKIYGTNIPKPDIGDNICADLACEYDSNRNKKPDNDEIYLHGETWCGTNNDKLIKDASPGSSSYRYVCYNGEVTIEPCADYRQETCLSALIIGPDNKANYRVAACVVNRWQDCFHQGNIDDCNNADQRDCHWVEGRRFDGEVIDKKEEPIKWKEKQGYCVPNISSGFDFWEEDTSAENSCGIASTICTVEYAEGFFGGTGFLGIGNKDSGIEKGGNCVTSDGKNVSKEWLEDQQNMCLSVGDCGNTINYLKKPGYYNKPWVKTKDLEDLKEE